MKESCTRRSLLMTAPVLASSWARATESSPIRIYGVELPPLIMAGPSGASGVITDIALKAFKRAGVAAEVEVVPWARGFKALQVGQCDGLIPTIRSAEREAMFDFPNESIYRSDMSFFGRANQPLAFSGKLSDVQDRKFVKLRGALFAPEFDEAVRQGKIACEETNSFAAALRMVEAGRVDLAAVPRLAGLRIAVDEGLQGRIIPVDPPFFRQPFYLAFARKPGLSELRHRFDEQLTRMWRDGSIAAIEDDYRRRNWQAATVAKAG